VGTGGGGHARGVGGGGGGGGEWGAGGPHNSNIFVNQDVTALNYCSRCGHIPAGTSASHLRLWRIPLIRSTCAS